MKAARLLTPFVAALFMALLAVITAPVQPTASATTTALPKDLTHGRVLALRPNRVELILNGRVRRSVPLNQEVDLADLARLVGDRNYISLAANGRVRLAAVLAARPGTSLQAIIPSVRSIVLADAGGRPAYLSGAGARLSISGVTILAAQVSGKPDAARPAAIDYGSGSRVSLTDVIIKGGGPGLRLRRPAEARLAGVKAVNTSGTGVSVRGGDSVRLMDVEVTQAAGDGILLAGPFDHADLQGPLVARLNTADGVVVQNLHGLKLQNISTQGNAGAGLRLSGVDNLTVERPISRADGTGLVVDRGTSLHLDDVSVSGSPREAIRVRGTGVQLSGARVTNSFEGLVVRSGSSGVQVLAGSDLAGVRDGLRVMSGVLATVVRDATFRSAGGTALRFSGSGAEIGRAHLIAATGLAVPSGGDGLNLTDSSVDSTGQAIEIARGAGVVNLLRDRLTAKGGVAVAADGLQLTANSTTLVASALGIAAHGEVEGDRLDVTAGGGGIRLVGAAHVVLNNSTVTAHGVGVAAGRGTSAVLTQTRVRAVDPSRGKVDFRGDNHYSHLPVRWVALAALLAVLAAVLLEIIRKLRDLRDPLYGTAPDHVLNRS